MTVVYKPRRKNAKYNKWDSGFKLLLLVLCIIVADIYVESELSKKLVC